MGEQSARHLRGKSMEDVIFNGSDSRPQHGFAEVTLTFDNSDGLAPPEYAAYPEISVTRRLGRDGASDYYLNKTPVRLMDVTNLFLGTGVGTKAYSIVEQGRVGLIVTSKPEDRRALFEEAAGITRFKARKKQAEKKIELTRQNLLRVSDLLAEIDKSLVSLKRQAQKAERYKALRAEQRDLELYLASHRYLELVAVHGTTRVSHARAEASLEGVNVALLRVDAEAESRAPRALRSRARLEARAERSLRRRQRGPAPGVRAPAPARRPRERAAQRHRRAPRARRGARQRSGSLVVRARRARARPRNGGAGRGRGDRAPRRHRGALEGGARAPRGHRRRPQGAPRGLARGREGPRDGARPRASASVAACARTRSASRSCAESLAPSSAVRPRSRETARASKRHSRGCAVSATRSARERRPSKPSRGP